MRRFTAFRSAAPLAVALLLPALFLSACSKDKAPANIVRMAMGGEPPTLNSTKATDAESGFLLGHLMEGLTRPGDNGAVEPGVAESWTITDSGATFKLRSNAKWSDGKPVTAKDFVFAWRTVVNPKTASEYAFILFPVKNAEAITSGKAPVESLGVTAKDDSTLEVAFEKPCGYFVGLTAFQTYYPVREDVYAKFGDKFAAEFDHMLYNGPFMLTEWVHGASLKLAKNPSYWNAAEIKLEGIHIPYITPDPAAGFNFFKEGKTDIMRAIGKDELPLAQQEKFRLKSHSDGTVWYMEFNHRPGRPTGNVHLRKAISLIFNRSEFVSQVVTIPGTLPGRGLIPVFMRGTKDLFRNEYPYEPAAMNLEAAKKELELAKKALGGSIPALVWLTGDTPASAREAEYFQNQFKTHLGLDLKIDKQIFKQRLAKMTAGEFDIVSAGWGPDYADPMTFADLMASWNENNRGRWKNAQYDAFIRKALATSDQKVRMDAMAAAEKLMLEEAALVPTYERVSIWTHSDRLTGVRRNQVGIDPDFTRASITSN